MHTRISSFSWAAGIPHLAFQRSAKGCPGLTGKSLVSLPVTEHSGELSNRLWRRKCFSCCQAPHGHTGSLHLAFNCCKHKGSSQVKSNQDRYKEETRWTNTESHKIKAEMEELQLPKTVSSELLSSQKLLHSWELSGEQLCLLRSGNLCSWSCYPVSCDWLGRTAQSEVYISTGAAAQESVLLPSEHCTRFIST